MPSRFAAAKLNTPIQQDARALLINERGASPAVLARYFGITKQRISQLLQAAQLHPPRFRRPKRCAHCNQLMQNGAAASDGVPSFCRSKPCHAARQKWLYQNKPELRAVVLQYQHATRPMQTATQIRWQKANTEKVRQYRRTTYQRRKQKRKEA